MATRSQINSWLTANQDAILAKFESIKSRRGRYVQMLFGGGMPADEVEDVAVVENLPQLVKDNSEIHVYSGPLGIGVDWILHAAEGGTQYRRTISRGAEAARRQHNWIEVTGT